MSQDGVQMEDMLDHIRFPCTVSSMVPIILYFPLGLLLAILRFFIAVHMYIVACILPIPLRRSILRSMCTVIGLVISVEDKAVDDKDGCRGKPANVLVANHSCIVDHVAINLVIPNITPSIWDIPAGLAWLLGYRAMGVKQGTDVLIENVKKHCQESNIPVLTFPEGGTTNGSAGLLKFSMWPFLLDEPIQPIALKVLRPSLCPVSISPVGSRWWSDAFWFLFSPYTLFKVTLLPVMVRRDGEEEEDFCERTQTRIADSLGIATTRHTDVDKVEYVKRTLFALSQPKVASVNDAASPNRPGASDPRLTSHADAEIEMMSLQVQDVLPDTPLAAIRTEIARTRNVDETINNFLEGKVTHDDDDASLDTERMTFGATTFSTDTPSRELSFSERKKLMIDTARARYRQKRAM